MRMYISVRLPSSVSSAASTKSPFDEKLSIALVGSEPKSRSPDSSAITVA